MAEIFGPFAVSVGLIALLVAFAFVAKRWGQASERADRAEDDNEIQEHIRDAIDSSPRDPAALADWLRRGGNL